MNLNESQTQCNIASSPYSIIYLIINLKNPKFKKSNLTLRTQFG